MDLVRHVDGAISLDDESSLLPSYVSERREPKLVPLRKRVVWCKITSSDVKKYRPNTVKPTRMWCNSCEAYPEGYSARPATALADE